MKLKFLYIFSLLSTIFTYGQVTLVPIIEDKDPKVNEKFTVTFVLEIDGNEYIQETPLRLPDFSKFNMIGTASDQNTYVDPRKNIVINQIVYQAVLEPKQTGKIKIGSAVVQVNGKLYKTEPFDIYVNEAEKKTSQSAEIASANQQDLYLNMEVNKREVYTNQPTIAILRAYSKDFNNFRKVKDIEVPNQENLSIRTVSLNKSDIEHNGKGEPASQVIAIFMIFPTEPGKVEIEPVSAKIKDKKIQSNKVNLHVKKLPEGSPADFKNAVGKFTMNVAKNSEEKIEVDKPINVEVKLSGEGNLQNAQLPKILPGENYKVFPPKIVNRLASGKEGLKGEVVAQYIVVPTKPGKISIETEGFAYFNPHDKKYFEETARMINLNVLSHNDFLASKSTLEKVNEYTNDILETVNTPIIGNTSLKVKDKGGLNWNTILLNIALFSGLAFLIFYIKKERKKKKMAIGKQASKAVQTIAETEEILRESQKFSIADHLHYLEKMKDDKNAKGFFMVYDEMVKDIEKQYVAGKSSSLSAFIEQQFGSQEAHDFQNLSKKISVEKYAPVSSDEDLEDLYNQIYTLFSRISK